MANPYDDFAAPGDPHAVTKAEASPYDNFAPSAPLAPIERPTSAVPSGPTMGPRVEDGSLQGDSLTSRIFRKVDDFARSMANNMSFGLADKIAGAAGGSQEREAELSRQARERSPLASLAGAGAGAVMTGGPIGAGIRAAVPALAKNTIPRMMAVQGLTGAIQSAGDDIGQGSVPDPLKAAGAAGIGAAGVPVISGAARMLSPTARFRASGLDLTDADKAAAKAVAARGAGMGIPISVPEAVGAAAPTRAGVLQGVVNDAVATPKGSSAWSNFEAGRPPLVAEAARRTAAAVADGAPDVGPATQAAAKQSIRDAKDLVRQSAKLDYDKAGNATGFPLPRDSNGVVLPAIQQAMKKVKNDPIVMGDIGKSPPNSISYMQAARDKLGKMYKKADKAGDGHTASLIAEAKDKLTTTMQTNKTFRSGDETFGAGQRMLVDPLKAGPLGALAKTNNSATQARSLMDIATPQAERQSLDAVARLGGNQPEGLMAARLQDMASRKPMAIGDRFMPTEESRRVAGAMTTPEKMAKVDDLISVLKTVKSQGAVPGGTDAGGPVAEAYRWARTLGSGKLAKLMQDPANIDKLGELGGVEGALHLLNTGLGGMVADEKLPTLTIRKRRSER